MTGRGVFVATAIVLLASTLACGGGEESGPPTLRWYSYEEPSGAFASAAERCTEASEGRYRIEMAVLPNNADEQREQLVRRLAARDSDIDLMSMDVIWTAEFGEAGWILPWKDEAADEVTEGRLEAAVKSATYQDRLFAAPFTSNTQMLWYRESLSPDAPTTWQEALDTAAELQAMNDPHLFQVQGQRYEGLVVWFISLLESAGTSVLNEDGTKVELEPEATKAALRVMSELSNSVAAPSALATAREDDGRLAWEAGESAFMVNYTFVWPSANANAPVIAGDMRWARYPGVEGAGPSKVTIGGFNVGVGAYSDHPDLAFEAATCITQEENQLQAATDGGLLPTTEALFDDPELTESTQEVTNASTGKTIEVKQFPYADVLKETLQDAVQRPQTPFYNDVSLAIARTLHPTNAIDPEEDVERLRSALEKALKGEGLL
jgi:multiple sugar transport system substrate-binding protein